MNKESPMERDAWTPSDSSQLYRVNQWGGGLFEIDGNGELLVHRGKHIADESSPPSPPWNLPQIVRDCAQRGASAPLLIRFTPIISHRLAELNRAFGQAIGEFGFNGHYQCVYPVKVNQHREVIDAFVAAARVHGGGLEAGSKAELLAVVSIADNGMPILCNGFKDATVIEMALRAIQIGRNVTIIIENPQDIDLILRAMQNIPVRPQLGLRVKLAARSAGRWQGSVGAKSKFGLNSRELETVLETLRQHDLIENCRLLHFHPGSQVNNIRNIKACIIEATRIYANLLRRGIPINTMDVGGGLAVDYTGNKNTAPSSMNYSLQEYANDVVYYMSMVCDQEQVIHPNIISESGRALVAHHSVLVVPVISSTSLDDEPAITRINDNETSLPLLELRDIIQAWDDDNVQESFHDAQQAIEMAYQLFINGHLTLSQRACAENMFSHICYLVRDKLNRSELVPSGLSGELRNLYADTYLANFSVFQSLPDHWALEHLFPIMPIHRLDERPTCSAVIGDITCDSDGVISCYLSGGVSNKSLPLHPYRAGEPYWLGIFLIGAYQEALSDDHNLFGKFHVVTVGDTVDGQASLTITAGSNLRDVLEHVHHDCRELLRQLDEDSRQAVDTGLLSPQSFAENSRFFRSCFSDYTYLADGRTGKSPPHQPHANASIGPRPARREVAK